MLNNNFLKKIVNFIGWLFSIFIRIFFRLYNLYWSSQFQSCGSSLNIRTTSVILSPQNISIGDNFTSMGTLYLYGNAGSVVVGNKVMLNTNVQIGASGGRIVIGDNVLIGPNVVLRAADHSVEAASNINEQIHVSGEINIGDDVWIGANAVITSDVTLAKGTVVGAGAVVTKSTEPYTIVAGVPAKLIARRH